jgi:hypothetical protein
MLMGHYQGDLIIDKYIPTGLLVKRGRGAKGKGKPVEFFRIR